jgi:Family of unknown function (DUF5677)
MTGLHARACRIAFEVHRLLATGFPMGALSRCRTVHELAVTSIILAEFGRQSAHADLAERFLLHSMVMSYKDALIYQDHCHLLGYEPYTVEEMAEMKQNYDELVARLDLPLRSSTGGLVVWMVRSHHFVI